MKEEWSASMFVCNLLGVEWWMTATYNHATFGKVKHAANFCVHIV